MKNNGIKCWKSGKIIPILMYQLTGSDDCREIDTQFIHYSKTITARPVARRDFFLFFDVSNYSYMPKLFLILFLFSSGNSMALAQSSAWSADVSNYLGGTNYVKSPRPICAVVKNGWLRLEHEPSFKKEYYAEFDYKQKICLTDNFTYEIRLNNSKIFGGIPSLDVGFGFGGAAGLISTTLMGEAGGQPWTNIIVNDKTIVSNKPYLVLDFSDWVVIKLKFQNNNISYSANGTQFFTAPYVGNICNIENLHFWFKGSGAIDYVKIYDNPTGAMLYEENFDDCNNMKSPLGCNPKLNITANVPCLGDTLKLSTNTRATSYEWNGPKGFKETKPDVAISKTDLSWSGTFFLKAQLNACQSLSDSIKVQIKPLPIVSLGNDTFLCSGKSLSLDAKNVGSNYVWQNGTTSRFFGVKNSGLYAVTVTNADNCIASAKVKIDVSPGALLAAVTPTRPSCAGICDGRLSAKPAGGFGGPYTFKWIGGRRSDSIIGLCAGEYTLTITDSKGCINNLIYDLPEPYPILSSAKTDTMYNGFAARCANSADAIASVHASGGNGEFSYKWLTSPFQFSQQVKGLSVGMHRVVSIDKNNCTDTTAITIDAPNIVTTQPIIGTVKCIGDKNGNIRIDSSKGGIPPYTYLLNNQPFDIGTKIWSNLSKGTYKLEVQDANNCISAQTLTIIDPPKLSVTTTPDTLIRYGDNVRLFAGADAPSVTQTVFWRSMRDSVTLSCEKCMTTTADPRTSTMFKVIVTDTFGCTAQRDIIVKVDKNRRVFAPTAFSPNGDGENDNFTLFTGTGTKQVLLFQIYNRWGALLYSKDNYTANDEKFGWDGSLNGIAQAGDVYFWLARIQFDDGEIETLTGDVTLLR